MILATSRKLMPKIFDQFILKAHRVLAFLASKRVIFRT